MTEACAFTGHRKLGEDFSEKSLKNAIEAVLKRGCRRFYCGMAYGFDLAACKALMEYKDRYSFSVVACIPCADQSKNYSLKDKKLYDEMCAACDEKVVLHDFFIKGCMFERDRYMVERSDVLIAYLSDKESGTGYTVNYAESLKKEIVYI